MTDTTDHGFDGPGGVRTAEGGGDGASASASSLKEKASSAASDAKDEAVQGIGQLRGEAMDQTHRIVEQARTQVGERADEGAHHLGQALASAGQELRAMADGSGPTDGPMSDLVRQVGQRASSIGDRIQQQGYRSVANDLSGFARSNPGTFLVAAAGVGFLVGRIVRNADTRAVADAVKSEVQQSGDSDGSSSEMAQPTAGGASPSEVAGRTPPGIGPEHITGLAVEGAGVGGLGEVG